MFTTTCTNEEKVLATVSYLTAAGLPAVVDGDTQVAVISGEGSFQMTGAHSFFLISGSVPGDTVYSITADADLGTGVQTITDAITLTVTNAQAAAFGVSFGTPEPK